jgi:hypothetical protein
MPLLLRLIELSILVKILTLRVSIGLSLGSPKALVVELIRWVEFLSCLLLLLVVLLRIRRHLGLIDILLGIIRIKLLGSRIRNEDRDMISAVLGNIRVLLLSILVKRGRQLGMLRVNGLIYPLTYVIAVPVVDTTLNKVSLRLQVLNIRILRSWAHLI